MAVIQPEDIAGLPELFAEVKALRQELELLKAGARLDPRVASPSTLARSAAPPDDDPDPAAMSPEEIRERVGQVIGERPRAPQPDVPAGPRPPDA